MKGLKCVEGGVEEWVGEWEGNCMEGEEEGREKETLSLLVVPLVVCVSTHTHTKQSTQPKFDDDTIKNTLSWMAHV